MYSLDRNYLVLGWGMPGHSELVILVLVLTVFFGAKRLPELARSLGRSMTEFRRGKAEGDPELSDGSAQSNEASADDRSDSA